MTSRFVRETIERAVKSGAQAAVLVIGADRLDAFSTDWGTVAGFAVGGFVLSVLTSLASKPLGPDDGSPSVV
jgi:hypothetical protein